MDDTIPGQDTFKPLKYLSFGYSDEEIAKFRAEGERRRIEQMVDVCGIPFRYREVSIRDYNTDIYTKVRAIIERDGRNFGNMYLYGGKGVGKTSLACAVLNYFIREKQLPAHFREFTDLTLQIRQGIIQERRSELEVIREILNKKVICVDDFAMASSDWVASVVWKLVNGWWNASSRGIIITSNMPIESLPYDGRVKDRMGAMFSVVKMEGPSLRQKAPGI